MLHLICLWLVLRLAVWTTEVEYHKRTKYHELDSVYLFVSLAIETSVALNPAGAAFFFILILGNGSQTSWRSSGNTPFCFSV